MTCSKNIIEMKRIRHRFLQVLFFLAIGLMMLLPAKYTWAAEQKESGSSAPEIVMIGDSYAQGYDPSSGNHPETAWPAQTASEFGAGGSVQKAKGGIGFLNTSEGINFFSLLQEAGREVSDRSAVQWVIVCGGYNDRQYSYNAIYSSVQNFVREAGKLFPAARVAVGMCGWQQSDQNAQAQLKQAAGAYQAGAKAGGGVYITGIENVLRNAGADVFCSDGIHINAKGENLLAQHIVSFMKNERARSEAQEAVSGMSGAQTGLIQYRGTWYYVRNGKIDWQYSNLVLYQGTWYYVHNGKIDWNYDTLSQVDGRGTWYYVENGKINWKYTGLVEYYGTTYYVQNGKLDWNKNGLVYSDANRTWYYVRNGRVDFQYTNLVQYHGTWYYVRGGRIDWQCTTLARVNGKGTWYYVQNGKINWNYTGLAEYYGTLYDIHGGKLDWSGSGLRRYQGNWYYVENGRVSADYSNLVQYHGTWYYVHNGKIDWTYDTLSQVNVKGTWYYVENGQINWNYSGPYRFYSTWYYVEKGTVVFGRFRYQGKWCVIDGKTGKIQEYQGNVPVIAIDPGHQIRANTTLEAVGPGASAKKMKVTGGAVGTATKQTEYALCLNVGLKLRDILQKKGYEVVMTRTTDNVNLSNIQRAQIANQAGADAFVRIHANSAASASVNGVETLCMTRNNPYHKNLYQKSRKLSEAILNGVVKSTGFRRRSVAETDTMTGINWSEVPVTIVEMGYLSNPAEDRKLAQESYRAKAAQGIADGIEAYLDSV